MISHLRHVYTCDFCNAEVERFAFLNRIKKDNKKVYLCKFCYRNNRIGFRIKAENELAPLVSNSQELVKIVEERKPKIIILDETQEKPERYIPWRYRTEEQRQKTRKFQAKVLRMGLTKDEERLLYSKGYKEGLDTERCSIKVNKLKTHLSNFVKELRARKVPEEDINTKFKEEFRKLASR